MTSKELHIDLINIGIKAEEIYNHNLSSIGRWVSTKKEGAVFIVDKDSEEYIYGRNDQKPIDELLKKLNNTFYDLLYKSHKENYFFPGSSYEVINKWVESNINKERNPIEGYDNKDFLNDCIYNYNNILKILKINKYQYHDKIKVYQFASFLKEENAFFFFLNKKNRSIVKRNLKKAKEYIENRNLEKEDSHEDNIDHLLNPKEKIICLNELGIINYLYENNQGITPTKLGKILEILIEVNHGNLRKIISSLRNENFDGFYPYASEESTNKVKDLLLRRGWDKPKKT